MGIFYTRKGDGGKSFVGKKKVSKTAPALIALGELDELNSFLGLVRAQRLPLATKKALRVVQEDLFIIQAHVASKVFGVYGTVPHLDALKIVNMEKTIDGLERQIKPAKKFVVPGETEAAAWLDVARTLVRRVERSVLAAHAKLLFDATVLAYMNRLSSLLFALARLSTKRSGRSESHPKYK